MGRRWQLSIATTMPAILIAGACGIAPVSRTPTPPPTITFVDPHGRPRAWGGGVCPVRGPHGHTYGPVPAAAFVDDAGAFRDTRTITNFTGMHPWRGRMCGIDRFHQHAVASPSELQGPAEPEDAR